MQTNLAETLRVAVNGRLPPTLISRDCQAWIGSRVRALPASMTSFFGYESRLQEASAQADFLLCIHRQPGGALLAEAERWLPADHLDVPAWRRLCEFARIWRRPGSPLNRNVENMWLEFDVAGPAAGIPVPFAFFKPIGDSVAADSDISWVLDGLQVLTGASIAKPVEARLRHAVQSLPAGGRVFQVAAMTMSRQCGAVRLCIRDIKPQLFGPYLERVGWPGDGDRVLSGLSWLRYFIDGLAINLDVSDTILPKLGLECYIDFNAKVLPRTKAFMDELVDRQLCLPEKRDDILAYHGWVDERSNIHEWPVDLITESMLMRPNEVSVFWRKLHHVKLIIQPDRDLEAKAYLLVCHSWLQPELLALVQARIRELRVG
jgi:hypothetical protein